MKHFAKKKRGFNEIYFVLYLSAIILLIPKKTDHSGEELGDEFSVLQNSQVFIKSEKSALNLCLRASSEGIEIVSKDSSNIIYPVGNPYSVDYHFSLVSGNKMMQIQEGDSTSLFLIEKLEKTNNIRFTWFPNENQLYNKNYTIICEADIFLDSLQKEKTYSRTEFSLNIYYIDEQPPSLSHRLILTEQRVDGESGEDNKSGDTERNIPLKFFASLNLLDIYPENNSLKSLAYSSWQNKIYLIGIQNLSDIDQDIRISVDSDDQKMVESVKILERNSKFLIIKGITPAYGDLNVEIFVKSKKGNEEVSTSFNVSPIAIGSPVVERVMYPEKKYSIDPKLPIISSQKVYSRIMKGDIVLLETNNSAKFDFTPSISDTGSTLYLERIIGTETLSERIAIAIKNYPLPEIISLREKGEDLLITTKSYGIYQSSKNLVVELASSQDLEFRDLTGSTQRIEGGTLQVFAINKSKLSNFKDVELKAIDSRGFVSKTMIYRK